MSGPASSLAVLLRDFASLPAFCQVTIVITPGAAWASPSPMERICPLAMGLPSMQP
jgi:hypothetical protein